MSPVSRSHPFWSRFCEGGPPSARRFELGWRLGTQGEFVLGRTAPGGAMRGPVFGRVDFPRPFPLFARAFDPPSVPPPPDEGSDVDEDASADDADYGRPAKVAKSGPTPGKSKSAPAPVVFSAPAVSKEKEEEIMAIFEGEWRRGLGGARGGRALPPRLCPDAS